MSLTIQVVARVKLPAGSWPPNVYCLPDHPHCIRSSSPTGAGHMTPAYRLGPRPSGIMSAGLNALLLVNPRYKYSNMDTTGRREGGLICCGERDLEYISRGGQTPGLRHIHTPEVQCHAEPRVLREKARHRPDALANQSGVGRRFYPQRSARLRPDRGHDILAPVRPCRSSGRRRPPRCC
jgi:hypothetical protein